MRSIFCLGVAGLAVVLLAQACGSDDEQRKARDEEPAAGAGGEAGAAGQPSAGETSGGAAGEPNAGDAGETNGGAGGEPAASEAGAATGGGAGDASAGGPPITGGTGGALGGGGTGGVLGFECNLPTTCTNDLSNVGAGDFTIAFKLTTTATVGSGLLSQRAVCMHSVFWDVRLRDGGQSLSIELDDATNYTDFAVIADVNDGLEHEIRVCRQGDFVHVTVDGERIDGAPTQAVFNGALPPLAVGTTTCEPLDGTIDLVGTVTDVCVGAL